jgi:hypothetical protein
VVSGTCHHSPQRVRRRVSVVHEVDEGRQARVLEAAKSARSNLPHACTHQTDVAPTAIFSCYQHSLSVGARTASSSTAEHPVRFSP